MAPGSGRDFNCFWKGCGKTFIRRSDLCRHHRIHTNERPYHCMFKDCNKSFIQQSALTVHSRTHTGEKPHICDHNGCHRAFSDVCTPGAIQSTEPSDQPTSVLESGASSEDPHGPSALYLPRARVPAKVDNPASDWDGSPLTSSPASFCRKTTLLKHLNRSHPTRAMDSAPSEDISPGRSCQPSATTGLHDQYLLSQPSHRPPSSTSITDESYSTQPIVALSTPVSLASADVEQYIQLTQHQSDSVYPVFVSLEFQPASHTGVPPVDGHVAIATLPQDFPYNQQTHLLNQLEGTDWGFLGLS